MKSPKRLLGAAVKFAGSFDGQPGRTITRDGEPWFVNQDVCCVLDHSNARVVASRLDDDEKDGVNITDAIGREQQTTIINESGLYSLILTSRKPEAKRFKKWITAEVIPSIRKTGRYGAPDPRKALDDPAAMRGLLLSYTEKVLELEAEKAILAPKVEALDRIATAGGSLNVTAAAKALQVRPKDLVAYGAGLRTLRQAADKKLDVTRISSADWVLAESWSRIVAGSGQRHKITSAGNKLVEEGFV